MCKKNITQPFKFFCYTDNSLEIIPEVEIIPFVDHNLEIIVHNKLFLFSEYVDQYLTDGDRVFFDLDIVIKSNIDDIVTNNQGDLTLIHSVWRKEHTRGFPIWHHMFNSSCMTWRSPHTRKIWHHFNKDVEFYTLKYYWGMDSFLSYEQENMEATIHFFPERKFYSHLYGVTYTGKSEVFDPKKVTDIPVVLLNGKTTLNDYERYKPFYED